jgi:hypothetical protein
MRNGRPGECVEQTLSILRAIGISIDAILS